MSIDYFLRTWKVTQGDGSVEKGQRIKIQRRPGGGENDLEFVVPSALPGGKKGFGDGGWAAVANLHYVAGGELGAVIGTANVGQGLNTITIRGDMYDGRRHIVCNVTSQDFLISLPKAKHLVARVYRLLRRFEDVDEAALLRIVRLLEELGNIFEEAGEWYAEDEDG